MSSTRDTGAILDYWRAVEIFSPQNIPKLAPDDRSEPVFEAAPDRPLPWSPDHPLAKRWPPKNSTRRFTAYCGVLATAKVREILEENFGTDGESFDERTDGTTCLFAFSVTDDGRPLFQTFVLSSCAWATARTLDPTPADDAWLMGFEDHANSIASDFEHRHAIADDDEVGRGILREGFRVGRPLDHADLLAETERIANDLGLLHLLPGRGIRIGCSFVATTRQYAPDKTDFLNSFYLTDLARVADEARNGNVGKALNEFLADQPNLAARIDVRQSIATQFHQLSPSLFPRGRWPSKGHHPLVFSQQFAINSMSQELGTASAEGAGLFAVNGPPGTGKTTLLRDLIASVVVERAMSLAELSRPEQAFKGEARWKTDKYNRVVSLWKNEFQGFEIVIASANNGAIENVTREIPGIDAVDASWLDNGDGFADQFAARSAARSPDYFADFGTRLLKAPAWAMVAARLGNKSNRNEFINRLWYGSKEPDAVNTGDPSVAGLLKLLKSIEGRSFDWPRATAAFKSAVAAEQAIRQRHERVYDTCLRSASFEQEITAIDDRLQAIEIEREAATDLVQVADRKRSTLAEKATEADALQQRHQKRYPKLLEIILTLGKAVREWRATNRVLVDRVDAAEALLTAARDAVAARTDAVDALKKQAQTVRASLDRIEAEQAAVQEQLRQARQAMGTAFPAVETWRDAEDAHELSSPWADPAWNDARAKVFLAALALHKAFVLANPATMRQNLQAAMDVLSGAVPGGAPEQAVRAAWTTLFFLVPVASTTFASFDRLFSHLGRESLGWLLIDEAGQAAPQLAAGAIWRARRVVVVGDPLQLEPVVTIPFTAQQALRRHYGVAETWLPGHTSVQQLADRASRFGTTLTTASKPLWVGSPLRVHRRCDRPMFDISNAVAYDGLMVFGTTPREPVDLPSSQWIHIAGGTSEGHWIEGEGQAVEALVEQLLNLNVDPRQIFLISPFRAVVRRLRELAGRAEGIQVGTIHTAQGKESDVVILVLGGDPAKPGAKQWASQRPNLLNVAASRAKRRLYVVGNRDAWRKYPYFSDCAALLDEFQVFADFEN